MAEILKGEVHHATTDDLVFRKYRIQPRRVGRSDRSIYLAGTPPARTGRSLTAPARPAQLPLHRVSIPRPRRRVTRSAAGLCASRGLWRHYCGHTCVVFAAIAAQYGGSCGRLDLQRLGFSRHPQRFLPGQSRRTISWAVGSRILPSDCHCAAAADYSRTRFPHSAATSTCTRNARKPAPSVRVLGPSPGVLWGRTGRSIAAELGGPQIVSSSLALQKPAALLC